MGQRVAGDYSYLGMFKVSREPLRNQYRAATGSQQPDEQSCWTPSLGRDLCLECSKGMSIVSQKSKADMM